jgi:hypothetical protein
MVRYAIRDLHTLLLWMDHMSNYTTGQERYRQNDGAMLNKSEKDAIAAQMPCIRKHFVELELHDSLPALDEFTQAVESPGVSLGECRGRILSIRRILTDALQDRAFMYVPIRYAWYAGSIQRPHPAGSGPLFAPSPFTSMTFGTDQGTQPFGKLVHRKFEKARYDAEQVSLCLLAGAFTAAIFHMMRVVEWGVRALGEDLSVRRIKEVVKPKQTSMVASQRPPKQKPIYHLKPLENCTWETMQGYLRKQADKRLAKLRPGPAKDEKQAFYSTVFQNFHGFREAWRNHVMHTRMDFREPDAIEVLSCVNRFMNMLASIQK